MVDILAAWKTLLQSHLDLDDDLHTVLIRYVELTETHMPTILFVIRSSIELTNIFHSSTR